MADDAKMMSTSANLVHARTEECASKMMILTLADAATIGKEVTAIHYQTRAQANHATTVQRA